MTNPAEIQRNPDDEIVERAQQGHRDAMSRLLREHHQELRGFLVRRVGDLSIADDLAQDVFLAAVRKFQSAPTDTGFRSWLFAVARNKLIDYLRRRTREIRNQMAQTESTWMLQNAITDDPPGDDQRELGQTLTHCIKKLNPQASSLITDYYFNSLTAEEIATRDDRSGSAVRMALLRIRKVLARCIKTQLGSEVSL